MLELKVAQRKKAKLKLGMASPSGGGKTMGALLIAYGLMKEKYPKLSDAELWAKIAIIDSEAGSGELYVGVEVKESRLIIGSYNAITLTPPFEPDKYSDAIHLCAENGIEVVIIDSTTHLWIGQGGALQQQGDIAKRTGNSWTAWRDVTPQLNRFVDAMLQTDVHIIATMRSKMEHVQEKDSNGKTIIRKVGMAPVQKDGMEYEFTAFIDIDAEHQAFGSKDRSGGIIDQKYFLITPQVGRDFMKWLESGADSKDVILASSSYGEIVEPKIETMKKEILVLCTELSVDDISRAKVVEIIETIAGKKNPNAIKDLVVAEKLLVELNKMKENK
jgi:hypothetical protein